VWGYVSELERTMVLGKPTDEQRRFFDHMVALQDLAIAALQPGRKCSDVDSAVRAYFDKHNLNAYWKHHTGHAIGLRYHEAPFLDTGDDTEVKPGMVFTVEPGLYVPTLGGFRHSDTVLVNESGNEMLTFYPRDLESLTLPV
jgi:Xaa-Pro aminopeptidase